MRVRVGVVVSVLVLVGCSGGGSPAGERSAPAPVVPDPPAGLYHVAREIGGDEVPLNVYNLADGALLQSYPLPRATYDPGVGAVSTDRKWVAGVQDCAIVLLRWSNGGYREVTRWQAPQSFGAVKACLDDLSFGQDNRVHARLVTDTDVTNVSFDPAKPADPLRQDGAEPRMSEKAGQVVDGRYQYGVELFAHGTRVGQLSIGSPVRGVSGYFCETRIDDRQFACWASRHQGEQQYGAVAVATVDLSTNQVRLRQVTPSTKEQVYRVVLSVDRREVLIWLASGWYRTDLAGGKEPVFLFPKLVADAPGRDVNELAAFFWR